MLLRHVLRYLPSLLVPAIASFTAIFFYTRLLTPHDYGYYALVLNTMTLLNAVFFYWLQVSIPRLMPQAIREGKAQELRVTSYLAHGIASAALVLFACAFIGMVPLGNLEEVAWLALPMALARGLLNMNQAFHRSAMRVRRFNVIECGQALLGLTIGLILVAFFDMGMTGAILGMVGGMMVMVLVDIQTLIRITWRQFDLPSLDELLRFGGPLVISFGLGLTITTSDRYIIEHFRDVGEVGIYAAGYSLVERIVTIIFMLVVTPSFPLTVDKLEREGVSSAEAQTYQNGTVMLLLALPACVGLILTAQHLVGVMVGEEFREGAARVMPWIAIAAVVGGMSQHYFDHAFHLSKKPLMFLVTQTPLVIFCLTANLMLIPKYGYMGAAYVATATSVLQVFLSILIGRRFFKIRFPFFPALQIALSTAMMAAALLLISFPKDVLGLAEMVVVGISAYGMSLLALNVMEAREKALAYLRLNRA